MSDKVQTTLIKIDIWSIAKIVLIVLGLWFLYVIRDVILILFVAGLLAAIITPAVNYFEQKKMPRWLGALIVYLVILLVLIAIGFAIIPTVVAQSRLLVAQLPEFFRSILEKFSIQSRGEFTNLLNNWLGKSAFNSRTIFSFLGTAATQTISVFMVFVIAFYLSVKKKSIRQFINSLVPGKYQQFLEDFFVSTQKKIGDWARGLGLLIIFVGLLSYVGLSILGVKYALTLAVIAGLTEVIPYIGPLIGVIPAVIIAFIQSPALALLVLILYLVIQQIENVLVSPYVMHKAVGLDPLVIIIVLLIGGKIAGPVGMILAVPVTTIISILAKDYLKHRRVLRES
ncbi:AI-2E family transporter [Patescibacteria group bacterium]|nr:AI-2E family transporter [Patescibacteria group bacterium]